MKNIKDRKYFKKKEKNSKNKQNKDKNLQGFTTLNQVTGVPKSHDFHSQIPADRVKSVKEPLVECIYCNEKITQITDAFSLDDGFAHFECVLNKLKGEEKLSDNQKLSYSGRGNFSVFELDEEGKYHIVKTISVESQKSNQEFKDYIQGLKE